MQGYSPNERHRLRLDTGGDTESPTGEIAMNSMSSVSYVPDGDAAREENDDVQNVSAEVILPMFLPLDWFDVTDLPKETAAAFNLHKAGHFAITKARWFNLMGKW
jgi:hypothetical protein